jgi:5-methylcytosine-specific restriction protein B
MSRFAAICSELADGNMSKNDVIDAAIMQKLLPKLHGSRNKIEPILKTLGQLCLDDPNDDAFLLDDNNENKHAVKYALSYEKLMRMHDRVLADGFTSFAEA